MPCLWEARQLHFGILLHFCKLILRMFNKVLKHSEIISDQKNRTPLWSGQQSSVKKGLLTYWESRTRFGSNNQSKVWLEQLLNTGGCLFYPISWCFAISPAWPFVAGTFSCPVALYSGTRPKGRISEAQTFKIKDHEDSFRGCWPYIIDIVSSFPSTPGLNWHLVLPLSYLHCSDIFRCTQLSVPQTIKFFSRDSLSNRTDGGRTSSLWKVRAREMRNNVPSERAIPSSTSEFSLLVHYPDASVEDGWSSAVFCAANCFTFF